VHHEPPEVAWLLPELDTGLEPELKPLEPDEFDELEPDEVEPEEPEEVEPDEPEVDDDPEVVEDVPEDDVAVLCVDPGRARARAPVTATLAIVTAVVVERTLARPCSLAATAWRRPSRCALLMGPILRSGFRRSLDEASGFAMRPSPRSLALSRRLCRQHEGRLKGPGRLGSGGMADPRAALLAERSRTLELMAALEREFAGIAEAASAGGADDEHDPEGATLAFEREHTAALLAQARDRLAAVDEALARLDAGRYGVCDRCGQPIGADRLAARPAALTCVRCAARR
jgi:DnaK suppressor protein